MLQEYYISKSLTKKVLFLGCEKLYLRIAMTPFLLGGVILKFSGYINLAVLLTLGFNMMIFLLVGQFLARKNPYFVEMTFRHYGYCNFYYAQRKQGTVKKGVIASMLSNESKGFRTYLNVNRSN